MNTSIFNILGCLFIVLFASTLKAQEPSKSLDAYQHLYEINKEWKHYHFAAPAQNISFENDTKRIRFHLESVIQHLSKVVPPNNNATAQQKREELLAELQLYAEQETFPLNIYHSNRQPYFIDHKGTHCAVGYLMKVSGASELAQKISKEHNYDYINDIQTKGVADWAKNNGFLLEELAWIQPGYMANEPFETLEKGTNGPVNKMASNNDKLYFAGNFNLLDSLPCLNIGVYQMGQLSCLGNGIDGKINDISLIHPTLGILIVVGDLIDNGNHYPIAIYGASGWTFYDIPNRIGAEGVSVLTTNTTIFGNEVAITHPFVTGTEIWKKTSSTWEPHCIIHGVVHDMLYNGARWYAGDFDSISLHRLGTSDTVLYSHNAIAINFTNNGASDVFSLSSELPNTITVISSSGNNLYFGGYSNSFFSPSVTRYLNGSLQTLLYEMDLMDWNSTPPRILDIYADINSGNLYIAGQIQQTPMNGTTWNSLLEYNVISGQSSAFNLFDSTISSVFVFEGELIVGGPFTGVGPSWNNQPLNHFARLYTPTAINTLKENLALKVFPNPTNNAITIDLGQEYVDASIEVSNALGQSIYQKEYTSTNSINLSLEGESGLYLVKVKTEDSESILKVVKQ